MTATMLDRVLEGEKVDMRNVYQRKLAVMAKCDAIKPDAEHAGFHFTYNSVQHISNKLRQFAVEEGLDITTSAPDGHIRVVLTNSDDPADQIIADWPLVPQDKAWAYSSKYALVRIFLIGDGTEGDEAENAERSGNGRAHVPAPVAPRPQTAVAPYPARQGDTVEGDACPYCAHEGLSSKYALATKGPYAGKLQCRGRRQDGSWCNHLAPPSDEEVEMANVEPSPLPF